MALSFVRKGDIGKYFNDSNRYQYLVEKQRKSWQGYVDGATSFIVKDRSGRIVGVAINHKFHFNPAEVCAIPQPDDYNANVQAMSYSLCKQIM